MARAGVSPGDAADLSLYDAITILDAAERRGRDDWHRARFMAMYSLLPHVKKDSIKSERDLCEFAWEKARSVTVKRISAQDFETMTRWDALPLPPREG